MPQLARCETSSTTSCRICANGLRMLRQDPCFTTVAVLLSRSGLAQMPQYSAHRRLVYQACCLPTTRPAGDLETQDKKHGMDKRGVTSAADFFGFSASKTLRLSKPWLWGGASLNLTGDGLPELSRRRPSELEFFCYLGAKPIFGRTFTAGG